MGKIAVPPAHGTHGTALERNVKDGYGMEGGKAKNCSATKDQLPLAMAAEVAAQSWRLPDKTVSGIFWSNLERPGAAGRSLVMLRILLVTPCGRGPTTMGRECSVARDARVYTPMLCKPARSPRPSRVLRHAAPPP